MSEEVTLLVALRGELRTAPCYLGSGAIHLVALLILLLQPTAPPRPTPRVVIEMGVADGHDEGQGGDAGSFQEMEPDAQSAVDIEEEDVSPITVTADLEIPAPGSLIDTDRPDPGGGPDRLLGPCTSCRHPGSGAMVPAARQHPHAPISTRRRRVAAAQQEEQR
jgi:hypothetical protein